MKPTKGERVFAVFNYLFMFFMIFVTLYPFLYVAFASFSNGNELMKTSGMLWHPLQPTVAAYKQAFKNSLIFSGFRNTIFVLVVKAALSMLLTILGAYTLSKTKALLTPFFAMMVVFTMFFHGGMIPTYLNVRSLGLDNSLGALILPTAVNTFNLIIMRTAFDNIPNDLEEAAKIDGAGRATTLVQIMLPLVVPTALVVLLYYAVATWNAWFDAMLYIRKKALYPLQLVLREILFVSNSNMNADTENLELTMQYAIMMIATVPILVLYPFLQKYFVTGVMIGAVKG